MKRATRLAGLLSLGLLLIGLTLPPSHLVTLSVSHAADSNERLEHDRKVLKEAGLPTAGADLLDFFRGRTLSDAARARLTVLVKQLGDDDFSVREKATVELIGLGLNAEPALAQAVGDNDAEVADRAKRCLAALAGKRVGSELLASAARVLAADKPPAALDVLLDYLPSADELVQDEIVALVDQLGSVGGKLDPAVRAAAENKTAVRRLAAAAPLARAGGADRALARKLLQDPEPRVRLAAAQALVRGRDKSAVPTLIALIGTAPLAVVWQAEDQLSRIAGEQGPQAVLDPSNAASREKCRLAWEGWWKTHSASLDLAKLPAEPKLLGLTLICDFDGGPGGQGVVWECGADGKERWRIDSIQGPADVQVLTGGRVLVAEHNGSRVTERTRDGKVIWEYRLTGNPVSAQRLANGNTFIATYTDLLEVTREGKKVFAHQKPQSIYCAQKVRDGHILYIHSSGQIVEMDAQGKEIRTVAAGNTAGWGSVELLPNGRFLISLYNSNKVKEIDANGQVFLDINVPLPTFATRLANGNTLATDTQNRRLVEYDQLGKEVWRQQVQGRPFRARRR